MKFHTGFEDVKERKAFSRAAAFTPSGDSKTVQADAKDADINVIMERYARTGNFPGLTSLPSYGDFDGVSDFREALHVVRDAEQSFMQLPAKVRAQFDNDAVRFVEYCDQASDEDLVARGILNKEVLRREESEEVKQEPTSGKGDRTRAPRETARAARRDADDSGDSDGSDRPGRKAE